jgi:hypothetical protein
MNRSNQMKALSAAIAIAGIAAIPAFAQDATPTQGSVPPATREAMPPASTAPTPDATFVRLDADHDGAVGKGEAAANAPLAAAFAGLDADGNGSLDSTEYARYTAMPNPGRMDNGTSNDAGDMDDPTNDAGDGDSGDGTNDDAGGNDDGTPGR